MRVLMLGWEFPPFISGGLGTACYGLTKAMSQIGTDVIFVLPKPIDPDFASHVRLLSPRSLAAKRMAGLAADYELQEMQHVKFCAVEAGRGISPYHTPEQYEEMARERTRRVRALDRGEVPAEGNEAAGVPAGASSPTTTTDYGGDLFSQIERYARLATYIADHEQFDVIHAHDWMTYRAGIAVSALTGRPLVVHIHSTEFDRSGEHVNQRIYDIERQGLHFARKVIAVSHLTKSIVTSRYAVPAEKVEVVYNAIDWNGTQPPINPPAIRRDEKLVLFLGRITMQKGPEYFLAAAKRVLEVMDNVRFIMAGWGDMIRRTIELAAQMNIGHKVLFTGFLRGGDVDRIFRMADLYVMPSVSEPFGIAPLEAMSNDVPVIISKQSGVSEVIQHALKVDFWDVNEMANKIIAVLRHRPLHSTLREHGRMEIHKLSWADSARQCIDVYRDAISLAHAE
ncbi:MAG: glycosyltransferase [Phycisphaerae bacterium]|nr:glycosyltransferase [Phycisphaerae bacterium]